jgi:HlyD family secretion protein
LINPQEPLAEIGASKAFLLEMQVDEVDIARVLVGQQVVIALDAFEDQTFSAKVSKIYPTKDDRTQTFKVEALLGQKSCLPGFMQAWQEKPVIIIQRKSNALSIPADYLLPGNKVRTETGEVAVQIGARNINKIEILSGIDSTTVLLKP